MAAPPGTVNEKYLYLLFMKFVLQYVTNPFYKEEGLMPVKIQKKEIKADALQGDLHFSGASLIYFYLDKKLT